MYVAILYSGYDSQLILSDVKLRHGNITVISNNMERYTFFTINNVTYIDSYQFMLSSLNNLSSNMSKQQFREIQKYLESFYIQEPNKLQTNNVTEGGKEKKESCTSMKTIKITLTNCPRSCQINNNKLKKTWHWWHRNKFTRMKIWSPLNDSKNHSYHPKTRSLAH